MAPSVATIVLSFVFFAHWRACAACRSSCRRSAVAAHVITVLWPTLWCSFSPPRWPCSRDMHEDRKLQKQRTKSDGDLRDVIAQLSPRGSSVGHAAAERV